jgi:hypothetical protein
MAGAAEQDSWTGMGGEDWWIGGRGRGRWTGSELGVVYPRFEKKNRMKVGYPG